MEQSIPIVKLEGLGLSAQTQRRIKPGNQYTPAFPAKTGKTKYLGTGTTSATIQHMVSIIKSDYKQCATIASIFRGEPASVASQIERWMQDHIRYKNDSPTREELHSPAQIWADRATGVDCDGYAIMAGCILYNHGIPFVLRKTGYGRGYQHVYVIVPHSNYKPTDRSTYTVIDPVVPGNNYEKPYVEVSDTLIQPPKSLNGLGAAVMNMVQNNQQQANNNTSSSTTQPPANSPQRPPSWGARGNLPTVVGWSYAGNNNGWQYEKCRIK